MKKDEAMGEKNRSSGESHLFVRSTRGNERSCGHESAHHGRVDLIAKPAHHLLDDLVGDLWVASTGSSSDQSSRSLAVYLAPGTCEQSGALSLVQICPNTLL